jgi:hypothetical protein
MSFDAKQLRFKDLSLEGNSQRLFPKEQRLKDESGFAQRSSQTVLQWVGSEVQGNFFLFLRDFAAQDGEIRRRE